MDFKDIVILIIQLATPFAIVFINHINSKRQKEKDNLMKLERQIAENKRKELTESLESAIGALQEAKDDVELLQNTVQSIQDQYDSLRGSLLSISNANRLNGRYTHELANLVTSLSEGIRDQHLDGNITSAISRYRKFESDALGSYMAGDKE